MCLPSSEVNKDPVLYLHWMSNCLLSLINESSKKELCQTEPGMGRDFSGGILGGLSTRREGPRLFSSPGPSLVLAESC